MNALLKRAAAGLLVPALFLAACTNPLNPQANTAGQAAAAAERYTVATGDIENTIVATGKVVPRQTSALSFARSGQVITVTVAAGDRVRKGQVLAELDTTDLKLTEQQQYAAYINALATYSQTIKGPSESEIASAKSALQSAQAQYNDLLKPPSENDVAAQKAALENARIALENAQGNYDRAFRRNPAGIGGSSEAMALQQATISYNQAKANYDKMFEKAKSGPVSSAASQIAAAKARVDALAPTEEAILQAKSRVDQAYVAWQQAQQNTAKSAVVAPFDGTVTVVNFSPGDTVGGGAAVFQLVDLTRPLFEVDVDEADIGNVRIGGEARVTLQAFSGAPLSARVEKIAPQATVAGNVTTVKVSLAIGAPAASGAATTGAGGGQGPRAANLPPAAATAIAQGTPPAGVFGGAAGQGQAGQGGAGQAGPRAGGAGRVLTGTLNILPGLSGTSEIIISAVRDAVVVPNRALVVDRATRGFTLSKLLADGKTETVAVQVGARGSSTSQIVSGVTAGDVIVLPSASTTAATGNQGGGPGGGIPIGIPLGGGR